jgi:cysteine desulfurase
VQWLGKEPVAAVTQFNADLVSFCGHKLHGPKGVGALYIRSPLKPDPLLFGGSHEHERRAGTENLAGIVGFVEAAARFVRDPVFPQDRLRCLTAALGAAAEAIDGVTLRGSRSTRLSNTVGFTVCGCDSLGLLAALDLEGICASSGSACSAGALRPSHVLLAMGVARAEAAGFVRFSLGRESSTEDVAHVAALLAPLVERVRGAGGEQPVRNSPEPSE